MTMPAPIRTIAVVGDGLSGWTTAAALARRLPGVVVRVVPVAGATPAATDQLATMTPSAVAFHAAMGLGERQVFDAVEGVHRLGVRLVGWTDTPVTVAYGQYGVPTGAAAFHLLWARADDAGPFDAQSPAAMLAAANRFIAPDDDPASPMCAYETGLAADPARYRDYMCAYARHLGVQDTPPLVSASVSGDRITGLTVAGGTLVADLYVDASGPDAVLLTRLPGGGDRVDWSGWLPANRLVFGTAPADPALPPVDIATARKGGWHLAVPLSDRTLTVQVRTGGEGVSMAQGRRIAAWIGNCVSVGDAAVEIEPLASPHLRLLHAAIDRIVALLPDTGFARVEIDHYNHEWRDEADRMRDFTILHHVAGKADAPCPPELPPELEAALALFRQRGRLPHQDGDLVGRDRWLAVLMGLGERPRVADALLDTVEPAAFDRLAAGHRAAIARAVALAPRHVDTLPPRKTRA
ncbi:hypothetical protein ASE75_01065 [Sphingomonas sp. Leaf17]|uniref:tryptophan 7-halogenase n=1 Tax=Sphingomonas sp. Leaf17 TaxID=1735683 RepID=UPI00070078B4|nr:tryptophan 7-halogenase [Sphingomonas sp. Leaf17]KQM67563.1 hypothetical protein ASE75_01065 [Sphingomonas sp. Leaf17]